MKIRNIQRNFSDKSEKGDAAIAGGAAVGAAGGLGSMAYKVSSARKAKNAIKEATRIASEELNGDKVKALFEGKQAAAEALAHEEGKTGLGRIFNSAKSKRRELDEINSAIKKITNQINSVKHAAIEENLAKVSKSSKRAKIAAAAAALAATGGIGTGIAQKLEEREFGVVDSIKRGVKRALRNRLLTKEEKNLAKKVNQQTAEINKAAKKAKKLEQEAQSRRDSNSKLNKIIQDLNKENSTLREEKKAAENAAKLWKVATAGGAIGGLGLGAAGGLALGN